MDWTAIASNVLGFISDNATSAVLVGVAGALVAVIKGFSLSRRPREASQGDQEYLTNERLLSPSMERPAYSDRMAYVLAEMSALAYWQFEGSSESVQEAAQRFLDMAFKDKAEIAAWLRKFADDLLVAGVDSEGIFRQILQKAHFQLLGTIDVVDTQGFVCKRVKDGEPPYLVLAFRGTEKKVSDWLTDAKATPTIIGESRMHSGFREALMVSEDGQGRTALRRAEEILEGPEARDEAGDLLPLYITGHSLGGALALMATKEMAADIKGACYTFGAPRIANYEYFRGMKTPVYRIVNSADIVPRVPPGAEIVVFVKLVQALVWLTEPVPAVSNLLKRLETWLDRLHGYRHYGDQRYLTDVKGGRFDTVRLLSNPAAVDRFVWFGQSLRINRISPVVSHGMAIYRKKLAYVALDRNEAS